MTRDHGTLPVAVRVAPVSLGDLQVAFTTLLAIHDTITDLQARCLSTADIENAARMIGLLEAQVDAYRIECQRLTAALQEAERSVRLHRRRSEDAEAKLASLQRTISQSLTEHLIEDDLFGDMLLDTFPAPGASAAS